MRDSDLLGFLTALTSPARLSILNRLRNGRASFTELMGVCGYDLRTQCGNLDYHLKRLVEGHLVGRIDSGYRLLEKGSRALRIMDQVKEKEFGEGEKVDERNLTVREFRSEDIENLVGLFPDEVRREIDACEKGFLRQLLESLVSGTESTIRADSMYSILKSWGVVVPQERIANLKEERLSLISEYKDGIVGFITLLTFKAEPSLVTQRKRSQKMLEQKLEELKRKVKSGHVGLSVVTTVWASRAYDKRKIVSVMVMEAKKRLQDKGVIQVQFISIRKEIADLLSECGFMMRDEIYLGLDPFKSKEFCDELSVNLGFKTLPLAHSIVYKAPGEKMTTFVKYPETALLWLP